MARRLWKKMGKLFVAKPDANCVTKEETDVDFVEYPADPGVYCHFLNQRPEEIADQLTLMDFADFEQITEEEQRKCVSKEWNDVPNIRALVCRAVSLRTWVVDVLLATPTKELRTTVLQLFVRMARRLHKLGNVHSARAVVEGLASKPVERLTSSWKKVSAETKKRFKKYCKLYLRDSNVAELMWKKWESKVPKCIPPVDLLFRDLESEDEVRLISNFVEAMQTSEYGHIWPENPCLAHYITSIRYTSGQKYYLAHYGVKISAKLENGQ